MMSVSKRHDQMPLQGQVSEYGGRYPPYQMYQTQDTTQGYMRQHQNYPGPYPGPQQPYPEHYQAYQRQEHHIPPGYQGQLPYQGQFPAHQGFYPPTNSYHQPSNDENYRQFPNQSLPSPLGPHPLLSPPGRSVVETKYLLTRSGPLGTTSQATAAASFFARNHKQTQQVPLQPLDRHNSESSEDVEYFKTNFRAVISKAPPALPSCLLRRLDGGESSGLGKVRVILRVASNGPFNEEKARFFGLDKKKRQVTLLDPSVTRGESVTTEDREIGVAAPKMFAFDGLFTSDDSQEDISAAALSDVITAVVNGNDGCLFCFGHANLGKTSTMVGNDNSTKTIGVIPTAIAWLYKSIKERKLKTGARFSVRVSAVEITNQKEVLRDLLANYASESDQSPGVYLRHLPASQGYALQNLSEIRASSVEKAAYYLDAALTERSADENGKESHLLYTLYVYQYSVDRSGKGGVVGGRSRLHLIDFGGCERTRIAGGGITLSGLGNVILDIFNGQKHLPCRDSKVTQVLRECLGSLTCHATMLAHVSPEPSHYSETLHTIQLASRVHRMRRKRLKTSSSGGSHGSTSSDEHRRVSKLKSHDVGKSGSSDSAFTSTDPSSSEQSCDTVVYRGHSDGSGTDSEHPPVFLPAMGSGDNRGIMSKALRGSCEEMNRPRRRSGSKILTNGAISPAGRQSLSPQPHSISPLASPSVKDQQTRHHNGFPRSPKLPIIQEFQQSNQVPPKMPLNGRVPGYRQAVENWIDTPNQNSPPQTKEIWVDGKGSNVEGKPRMYGYMDEFKANMISHWVENQAGKEDNNTPLYLTQFKQADSDSGSEKQEPTTKAQVHAANPSQTETVQSVAVTPGQQEMRSVRKLAPPPPPRKTPPKADKAETSGECATNASSSTSPKLSPRGEVEGSDSPEPLQEPHSLDDIFIQCEKLVDSLNKEGTSSRKPEKVTRSEMGHIDSVELIEVEERNKDIPMIDNGCQVTEEDIETHLTTGSFQFNSGTEHPLRILSEENLTVVSTFVADITDLESMEDDTEYDPSKFSFFEVPEFHLGSLRTENETTEDQYFETRLKELSKITQTSETRAKTIPTPVTDTIGDESDSKNDSLDIEGNEVSQEVYGTYSDPRFLYGGNKETLSTFSRTSKDPVSDLIPNQNIQSDSSAQEIGLQTTKPDHRETMTPQKHFLLLSQTLRHPDGSSNPDLNLVPTSKRSPGNGQSSSDQEDDINLNLTTYSDAVNGNQNGQVNNLKPSESNQMEEKPRKKESSNLAVKLFRLFGSTRKSKNLNKAEDKRSKSCDREIEESIPKRKKVFRKDFRSASSSPLKRSEKIIKDKPKTNKLSNKDKNKKEKELSPESGGMTPTQSTTSLLSTEWEFELREDQANGNCGDRNNQTKHLTNQRDRRNIPLQRSVQQMDLRQQAKQGDRKSSGYDSLESSSLDSSNDNNELVVTPDNDKVPTEYAVPTDYKEGMQYDEVDILKMEIRKHPNILRRAY